MTKYMRTPTSLIAGLIIALASNLAASAQSPAQGQPIEEQQQDKPTPREQRQHVLVFSKTAGFRHASIPDGVRAIEMLGRKHGFDVTHSEDSSVFSPEKLALFDAVVFLSTTGNILDESQQAAFEQFIRNGGGYVGIHAAADTEYEWPWYGELVGAYFKSHPRIQPADIIVLDREHASTRHLSERWNRTDEWYNYRNAPAESITVLMKLDESSYEGGSMQNNHAIAWFHEFQGGRAWYTGGGHTKESFSEPAFLQHILGGIRWAMGIERDDTTRTNSDATNVRSDDLSP